MSGVWIFMENIRSATLLTLKDQRQERNVSTGEDRGVVWEMSKLRTFAQLHAALGNPPTVIAIIKSASDLCLVQRTNASQNFGSLILDAKNHCKNSKAMSSFLSCWKVIIYHAN